MKIYNEIEQQTPAWHYLRKGKVTGTTLKAIIGTPKAYKDAFYTIVGERLTEGDMDSDERPMDRGNRLEDQARAMFEFKTGKKVKITGFCESDENQFIGFSPDGLIDQDDNGIFTEDIEIKCPETKNYVKAWFENEVPEEYYPQVIQSFIVNEKLEKKYFVLYHPEIKVHPMHIIEVHRGDVQSDIANYKNKELIFLQEVETKLKEIITI